MSPAVLYLDWLLDRLEFDLFSGKISNETYAAEQAECAALLGVTSATYLEIIGALWDQDHSHLIVGVG